MSVDPTEPHRIRIVGETGQAIDDLVDELADHWQNNPPPAAVAASAMTVACMLADALAHPEGSAERKWRMAVAEALAEHVTGAVEWWWPEQAADITHLLEGGTTSTG